MCLVYPTGIRVKSLLKVMANHSVKGYSELYSSPEDMDLWTAGISERPLPGSMVIAFINNQNLV